MTEENVAVKLTEHDTKIQAVEHRLSDLEDKTDRIENLTLSVQKLASSVEIMAKEQAEYREKQETITDKLVQLEQRPDREKVKKLDDIIMYTTHIIVAAVVGAFLAYIGLK